MPGLVVGSVLTSLLVTGESLVEMFVSEDVDLALVIEGVRSLQESVSAVDAPKCLEARSVPDHLPHQLGLTARLHQA